MQPYVIVPAQGSDQEDEWIRLGVEAQVAGKLPDAQRHYQHALRLNPRNSVATQNLAIVFAQSNHLNEALLTIERATMFDQKHSVMRVNRAFMCLEADRIDEALESANEAVSMNQINGHKFTPIEKEAFVTSRLSLAMISATAGNAPDAIRAYKEMLSIDPNHTQAAINSCFVQTLVDLETKDVQEHRKKWHETNGYKGAKAPHHTERNAIPRIGYVGGDFKTHSASMIFGNVLLNHDKSKVEVYFYSNLPVDEKTDGMTKRYKDFAGDRWRDITSLTDEQTDAMIRQDKIDILVDLAGHTNGGRLALFTRKPAPVQITAWGFAHGTGCPEIDYFFADPVSVPEAERQHFAEKIWDLPSVVSYLPPEEYNLKGVSGLPYHQNGYITFGSYARYEKLSDECLKVFAEILRQIPDAKIQFKDHAFRRPYSIRRIQKAMPDIDPERMLFSISTNHQEHMLAYQQADLILDPFPHGGGVVSLECLYMGVPILTRYGKQPSGRNTASILTAMGLSDWIAKDEADYIEKAVAKAKEIKGLKDLRKTLRESLVSSPVVKDYARKVEDAYLSMRK